MPDLAQEEEIVDSEPSRRVGTDLDAEHVAQFAKLALSGIDREYPNKPGNVIADPSGVRSPREMHPAFYGCYDWHSSVHGHWILVRVLRLYPEHPMAETIRARLTDHLSREALQIEAEYFLEKDNRSFERMYGWAWALRLVAELHGWEDEHGQRWRANLEPLEKVLVARAQDYLPKLSWPIRTGVHPDSAFALSQLLDYARVVGNESLEQLVINKARSFYLKDTNYPAEYEPSGEDFFSAGLNEADLIRRVLNQTEYTRWLHEFFPGLKRRELGNLLQPVDVSDVTDGKIVHLAGLNLSRAWTLSGIAAALPNDDPSKQILNQAAEAHATAGLGFVFSGHYEGEHWLATFAIYHLTRVGLE